MKKGNFLANICILASIVAMYLYYIYVGEFESKYVSPISMIALGVVSLFVLSGSMGGINAITSISKSFKRVRKVMHAMYVKDADNVWNVINGQSFLFKNQYLDSDMSNYKREMERIEEEGMVYTQADIADFINMDRINGQVKKVYLDALTKIITLITLVATMVIAYATLDSLTSYDHFVAYDIPKTYLFAKSAVEFVRPILIFVTYVAILVFEMTLFYKTSYARLVNEYNLFISDFAKQVMPSAKSDAINNVLYLQQLAIQNTKHTIEENIHSVSENFKDIIIRNSESSKEIDRHLEQMATSINGFNTNVEDMKLSIMDQTEHNKLASKNMLKSYKDVLDTFEKRMDTITDKMLESIKTSVVVTNELDKEQAAEEVDTNVEVLDDKVEEKEEKKVTKKATKQTTTKKTTTKKTSAKKSTTKEKVEKKAEEVKESETKEVEGSDVVAEIVEEVPVVKKKRGRKSKAEKEAEEAAKLALLEQAREAESVELAEEVVESAVEQIPEINEMESTDLVAEQIEEKELELVAE